MAALGDTLRNNIESKVGGFAFDAAASAARRLQVATDFEFFCKTYFPHYTNPRNLPANEVANSVLHDYLYKTLPAMVQDPVGWRLAVAAPRGEAKSTICSQLFVLWCIVTERKHYVCLIMDAFEQSVEMLEAIKAELEANPRLAMDYPKHTGQGRVWKAGVAITASGVKVESFGSGKRMRGRRHGAFRPDLAIADDIENDENVASPVQRDKTANWLAKTVMNLGGQDDIMDLLAIGTILHYDSVLSRLLNNPLWRRARFASIIQWPSRMDLWDAWEQLLLNTDDNGAAAQAYYTARKAAMDAGAVVSWPTMRPLIKLMLKRARDGHSAFDSEQQNDPLNNDDAPFGKAIQFWVNKLPDWVTFGACDPSLGKHGSNRDPSALLVGGYHRFTGKLYVIEALIAKRLPDKIIEDIIALQQQYRCVRWAVETVQFQAFLMSELVKRGAARGCHVPAVGINPTTDKDLRIQSLQPHMANGYILLHNSQHTLIQQLRHYPKADHDDGPDALHMLWQMAVSGAGGVPRILGAPRKL